jgi:hypothetical protein
MAVRLITIVFAVFLTRCMTPREEAPVYSREVVRVGDVIIKEDQVRLRVRMEIEKFPEGFFGDTAGPISSNPELAEIFKAVLEKMVEDYVILAYGRKKSLEIPEVELTESFEKRKAKWNPNTLEEFLSEHDVSYARWKQIIEDQIRVQYVMEKALAAKLQVSATEISNYYQKHGSDFDVGEQVRVRQIVTDTLEKAKDLHARIKKGENFAKLAVNHSLSPDRARGGDLGYFERGSFPKEFDDACFKLKKGEISPVVKSPYGFHIFKIIDRKDPRRKGLLEATAQIQQKLFEEKLGKVYPSWVEAVRKEVDIRIHQDVVDGFVL